jgi:putative oxidoreductase
MSWITIVAELLCGAAVVAGAIVPLVCIPMAAILLVALLYVPLQFGFSYIKLKSVTPDGIKFGPPGYEVIVLYLSSLWCLAVLGAGSFSIDSWLLNKLRLQK